MTTILSLFLVVLCLTYVFFLLGVAWGGILGAPYVPSNRSTTRKMIEFAEITGSDKVYDLGSGDGRLVFDSAEKAKEAVGYEVSLPIYLFSKLKQLFFRKKGKIRNKSFFRANLGDADVIFCYLLGKTMGKLQKKFEKELKKGTRIISHGFQIPGWKAVKHIPHNKDTKQGAMWMYVV